LTPNKFKKKPGERRYLADKLRIGDLLGQQLVYSTHINPYSRSVGNPEILKLGE
jgi:hypothetical protein